MSSNFLYHSLCLSANTTSRGRKFAFNVSLLISSIFAIVAGAAPNWIVLGLFVCLSAFGAGGNLVLDTTVFLEFLPSRQQWLLTLMACWWGLGQLVTGLFAWAFLPNYSCVAGDVCNKSNNSGWRYVWYTSGAVVFIMSILRLTIIRLHETPKFLVGEGRDQDVVDVLQSIAKKYNRKCSLTVEMMQACGVTGAATEERRGSVAAHAKKRYSPAEVITHLKGLFETKRMALSTSLIWFSWLLIGLAYVGNICSIQHARLLICSASIQCLSSNIPRDTRSRTWSDRPECSLEELCSFEFQ